MLTKYATQRCLPPIAFGPLRYRPIPHVFIINVFRLFVDNFYGKARFGIYYCGQYGKSDAKDGINGQSVP